ncbi:MAG: YfhO family protein [Bacilli bacterium]|nr:YfhO family protein [Bacilli bacterium]
MKNYIKKNKWFILTILSIIGGMLLIFGINNVYPFSRKVFPFLDFDVSYVPIYFRLWDYLHGYGSVFFDWNLGAGLNNISTFVMNSLFFPSSLIVGLFPRDYIPYAMEYILTLKYVTMGVIFYCVINKMFPKLDGLYKYLFTILYIFSGWGLLMMSSILYLDAVSFFPLLVLGLYSLLKDGKWKLYVFSLTIILLFNYYTGYQTLFFLVGVTIISLLTLDIKDKKKKAALIAILTSLSLGLSSFLIVPSIYQSLTSYRLSSGFYGLDVSWETFREKSIYLFTLGIPFVFVFKQLFVKKDKKINIFYSLLLFYLLLPLFLEPINALWHTGSHSGLPFRQCFIINFVLIIGGLYYLNNNYKNNNKKNSVNMISAIILLFMIVLFTYSFKNISGKSTMMFTVSNYQFMCTCGMFVLFIITMLVIFKLDKVSFRRFISILVLFNTFSFILMFLNCEKNLKSSITTNEIDKTFSFKDDGYNLVDKNNLLNTNFPFIIRKPAMNNRLHVIKSKEILFSDTFNYQRSQTIIKSLGGTMFTNALLQNKYFLTYDELNDVMYELVEKHDDMYLYQSKYNFNFIIPYSGKKYDGDSGSYLVNNNNLYKTLFDTDKDLIHMDNIKEKDGIYHMEYTPNKTYYMVIDYDYTTEEGTAFNIGENNLVFDTMFIDSENAKVHIVFRVDGKEKLDLVKDDFLITNVELGYIDDKEYIDFMEGLNLFPVDVSVSKNTKTYRFNIEEDSDILIPVNYDDAMKIYVNGEEVDYKCNAINMFSIKVKKGENEVVLKYVPKYFKEGIYISICSFILMIIISITNKKFHYLDHNFILYPIFGAVCLVGLIFIIRVYIISLF